MHTADEHRGEPTMDSTEELRILTEQQLPACERSGDAHGKAVTLARIADIIRACGNPDGALRILEEDVLPVFTDLGDLRSQTVSQGKIADILQAKGVAPRAPGPMQA